jgi:8-hydroxy-5-deazaflavin:NADPH oxidoreductase
MAKNIGIIGSGMVAQALAAGFVKYGSTVKMGTRDPAKLADFVKKFKGSVTVGTFKEAAEFGEILVLAVRGEAAVETLKSIGHAALYGKTVIDTTNPIDTAAQPVNGVLKFFTGFDHSLMELLQREAPDAHFVKAFSSIGAALMVNPDFGGVKPTMMLCGNSEKAKSEAAAIAELFGFEPEDMGGVEAARAIEPLCILWCLPGFRKNEWNHALKWLKK